MIQSRNKLLLLANSLYRCSRINVTTWNALASSFNFAPQKKHKLWSQNVGLFEISELSVPEGFKKLQDNAVKNSWRLIEKVVKSEPGEETVVLFDELSDTLCRVADMADFVRCAHPHSQFSEAAADAHLNIGTLVEELNTSQDLYDALHRVTGNQEILDGLDEETRTVADLFMFDFTISGIHLSSEKRKKAVELHEELLQLIGQFLQLSNSPVAFPKNQIPSAIHRYFNQDNDSIIVNGLQCEHPEEVVREAAYRLHYYINPETERLLSRLLQIRQEVAQLVGFESFAERTLKSTIAKTPETVMTFLLSLSSKLKPLAEKELSELGALKASSSSNSEIMQWDLHYYLTKLKAKKSATDTSQFSSYFSLGDCMDGLNHLFQAIFDVTVNPVETRKGEVWNDDIVKLAVSSRTDGVLGYIYCDFFNRPGKPQQDCHFTIRGGRRLRDGSYQLPIVVLMLHISSPTFNQPPLLSTSAMNNLFHEMGHAMHSMLARTRYQHITGTRCATDFAEVPSVLMEYFATDPRVLSVFAKHHKTRQPLPINMIEDLCKAERKHSALETQTQVYYSIADQTLHCTTELPNVSTSEIVGKIHNTHYSVAPVSNTSWHLRFSHLATYGAKYYSYLMSRAVASRLWNKCFVNDPFNQEMGFRFKREMLQHGGGKDPVAMYQDMLNETFDTNLLVDTLIDELQEKN